MSDDGFQEALECRVCRGEAEPDKPLMSPCLCSGSISYCHQSCLEEWLSFSQKTSCELCHTEYRFDPVYVENAPEYIPALKLAVMGTKKLFFVGIPSVSQFVVVLLFWLVVTPSLAAGIYRFFIRADASAPIFPPKDAGYADSGFLGKSLQMFMYLSDDAVSGICIICLIGVSFLVMISFADFLRLNWHDEPGGRRRARNRRRGAPRVPRRGAAALPPRPAPAVPVDQAGDNNIRADAMRDDEDDELVAADENRVGEADENEGDVWEDVDDENQEQKEEEAAERVDQIRMVDPENERAAEPRMGALRNAQAAEQQDGVPDLFFDDGGALDDLEAMAAQEPMDAVEIRIALNDVLGFYGSLTILLRSTFFFFVFNLCYIWTFGYVPFRIGNLYSSFFVEPPPFLCSAFAYLPSEVTLFAADLLAYSKKSNRLIAVEDLLVILLGYVSICTVIFTLGAISFFFQKKGFGTRLSVTPKLIKFALSVISIASSILKVGTLLFLRIFWLPLIIGCMSLFCTNVLFDYSRTDYVTFIVDNTVGFMSLAWVTGISFMLVVTLSVLQLREVLHPDILARRVRPQEAHMELLNSLVNDGGFTHIRRVLSSVLIYSVLLAVFIWLPIYILRCTAGKLDIYVYYFSPNLQLPFEMAMVHFIFLSFLEKYKDWIGTFQYHWLVYACGKLGLTAYLLPVASQHIQLTYDVNAASDTPASALEVVHRPPPGWDGRSKNEGTTRWAFDEDAVKSDVEKSLAPRQFPPLCYMRVGLLAISTWILVLGGVLITLLGLVFAGRAVCSVLLMAVPSKIGLTLHDPLCFVIGSHTLLSFYRTYKRVSAVLRHGNVIINQIPLRGHLFWIRYALLGFFLIPFALGFLIRRATISYDSESDVYTVLKHDFLLGSLLFHSFFHLVIEGFLFTFMDRCFGTHLVAEYHRAMALACSLFVADARADAINGLVINGEGENVPIPKALFVPPYTVNEVQAMQMWDRLESDYIKPFLGKLVFALLLIQFQRLYCRIEENYGLPAAPDEERFTQLIIVVYLAYIFSPSLLRPLQSRLSKLYQSIHDDMYLIGKKLRNFEKLDSK